MNKKENTPRRVKMVINVFAIILGISIILGVSYAIFRASDTGRKTNTIKTGDFGLEIKNESDDSINLTHSIPMREEDGLKTNPYTFDVVNTGDYDINYKLGFEISSDTTMPASSVRYVLVKDGVKGSSALVSSAVLENITTEDGTKKVYYVANYDIAAGATQRFKLYMWLDYDATESIANTVFKAKVRVDGEATTIVPVDGLRPPTGTEIESFGEGAIIAEKDDPYEEVYYIEEDGTEVVIISLYDGENWTDYFYFFIEYIEYEAPYFSELGPFAFEANKWYACPYHGSNPVGLPTVYTGSAPTTADHFTNVYSENYLDIILASFGN